MPSMLGGDPRVLPSNVRIRLDLLVKGRFAQWNGLSSLSRAGMMEAVAAGFEPRSRFEVLLGRSKGLPPLPCTPILIEAVATQVGSGLVFERSAKL